MQPIINDERYTRNQLILSPAPRPQERTLMSPPDRNRSFGNQAPDHNPAVRIARQEPAVGAYEARGVDLRGVAPEHVRWLRGW
jgi:hypothetical protein